MGIPRVKIRERTNKSGVVYYLDYGYGKKRVRETIGSSYRIATAVRKQRESELIQGKFNLTNHDRSVDLPQLIEEYLRSKINTIRDSSYNRYRHDLEVFQKYFEKFFPECIEEISKIKPIYIKECLDYIIDKPFVSKKVWSRRSANHMLSTLKTLFKYATENEYIRIDPSKRVNKFSVKGRSLPEIFTAKEIDKILKTIDPFWRDHILFLLYTGLRNGEIVNLKWDNIKLKEIPPKILITSSEDWETKSGKFRAIPIHKIVREILLRWQGKNDKYVFDDFKKKNVIHPIKKLRFEARDYVGTMDAQITTHYGH